MARVCELTGISRLTGNNVSNSNRRTKRVQLSNLHKKRYYIPELKRTVTLTLSCRAIRSVEKWGGIGQALRRSEPETLSPRLRTFRKQLQ